MNLSIIITIISGLLLVNYFTVGKIFLPWYLDVRYVRWMLKYGVSTRGVVIDIVQRKNGDDDIQYAPVIKYKAADGTEHLLQSDDFRGKKPQMGNRVIVYYKTDTPSEGIINPAADLVLKIFLIVLTLLILLALDIGTAYAIYNRWPVNE